jgi:hypothetical protein
MMRRASINDRPRQWSRLSKKVLNSVEHHRNVTDVMKRVVGECLKRSEMLLSGQLEAYGVLL